MKVAEVPVAIQKIRKRDGREVKFDQSKITNAIYKAAEAVGKPDFELARRLSDEVCRTLRGKRIPAVEEIQDMVEQVLMAHGEARIAKAYILYRQKRAEIRREKQQVLGKSDIDEVDKAFDINALRVLRSRYLKKDKDNNVIESPRELFERVAVHTTLASIFFDKKIFKKDARGARYPKEKFDINKWRGKLKIGKYVLNQFHLEALKRLYERFNHKKQMKLPWSKFLDILQQGGFDNYEQEIEGYYKLMAERKFMPNTPALANFGNYLGMGSACFVLGIDDSIESIMDSLKQASIIFKSGGGAGYNFSNLRPEGDFVKTTGGVASGPISFMTLFDRMTEVIKQGGIRRGANMGILNSNHPDIEKFITAKKENVALHNFNISVFIKSDFWEYYKEDKPYPLVNPRTQEIVKYVNPKNLLNLIAYQAWESAEPGVIYDGAVNKYNPFLESLGPIEATNPCGEVLLYPYESCNLGSINLWAFVKENPTNGGKRKVKFDWDEFAYTVQMATRFLDNVVEVNKYPLKEIEDMTLNTRKIGLGVMGLGYLLYDLEIPYNSSPGLKLMEKIMEFVNFHSKVASIQLAKERGEFPYYNKSFYPQGKLPFAGSEDKRSWHMDWSSLKKEIKKYRIRNAFTTVIAPTGSISMIAGCSSGIEPIFSLVYEKRVTVGSFYYIDPVFEKIMLREGLFDEDLIRETAERNGSIQSLTYIPKRWKRIFVTSMDIKAPDHIKALAAFQRWTDSSISKTINFSQGATIEEVKEAILLAYKLGCKDLTIYRDKSIKGVLVAGERKKKEKKETKLTSLTDVKAKGPSIYHEAGTSLEEELGKDVEICPNCGGQLIREEGCKRCPECGWGVCSV